MLLNCISMSIHTYLNFFISFSITNEQHEQDKEYIAIPQHPNRTPSSYNFRSLLPGFALKLSWIIFEKQNNKQNITITVRRNSNTNQCNILTTGLPLNTASPTKSVKYKEQHTRDIQQKRLVKHNIFMLCGIYMIDHKY